MSVVRQLSGLISDTIKRAVIINGKLVTNKGRTVYVKMASNYHISFLTVLPNKEEVELPEGDMLLDSIAAEFNEKYKSLANGNEDLLIHFQANIDSFTQTVVLKNGLYNFLIDKGDENHLHDGTRQFQEDAQVLLKEFVVESIINYLEIYIFRIGRRLTGGHMPAIVKGHLVAGLYQPLVVQTKHIECPLKFGELSWFLNYLNSPESVEEYIERTQETKRGLDLSVIAISDLNAKFSTPIIRELNRVHWLFILYASILGRLDQNGSSRFIAKYQNLYKAITENRGVAEGTLEFFYAFVNGIKKIQTSLMVVK